MKQNYATVTPCNTVAVGAAGVWKIDGSDKKTRSSATADGPARRVVSVKILSAAETNCTTNPSNGVSGLQLTDL